MKIDPAMLKEINKSIDDYVKKNKKEIATGRELDKAIDTYVKKNVNAISNLREIDDLKRRLLAAENQLKKMKDLESKSTARSNVLSGQLGDLFVKCNDNNRSLFKLEKTNSGLLGELFVKCNDNHRRLFKLEKKK